MFSYRKELDGLRALAVIAVILYHANIEIFGYKVFQGGFLGVDVFFVISGYLITSIVLNKVEVGSFNIFDFYWRRAKRIVPVLLVVLVVTTVVASFVFMPSDLVAYTKSLVSVLYFGSNYHFLAEDSYIADSSKYKALLHTWSLSVEWQFYLVYPLIVWCVSRFFKEYIFGIVFSMALLSFQYSIILAPRYPDVAFYSILSRAWELLLGGVLVFFRRELILGSNRTYVMDYLAKLLPVLGGYMMMYGFLFFDDKVIHPSFFTLIPVLGACFFILFSYKGEFFSDLMSLKPIVGLGLISYSLYLVHQPVFVFFRFLKDDSFRHEHLLLLISISVILAIVFYCLIEKPYRERVWGKSKWLLVLSSVIGLYVFSYLVINNDGYPERIPKENHLLFENFKQAEEKRLKGNEVGEWFPMGVAHEPCILRDPSKGCRFGDESWVTLGSSYVGMFEYELQKRLSEIGKGIISQTYYSCPFFSTNLWMERSPICPVINEKRWEIINEMKERKTFLINAPYFLFAEVKVRESEDIYRKQINRFSNGKKGDPELAWSSYVDNINKLVDMGHRVVVIYPMYNTNVNGSLLVRKKMAQNKSINKITFEPINAPLDEITNIMKLDEKLDSLLFDREGLYKLKPLDILCKDNVCPLVDASHGPLFNNGTHLSNYAVGLILDEMNKSLEY